MQSGAGIGANPIAILVTIGSFALFLTITAHIAARNVLGDVPIRDAFLIGPLPAIIAVIVTAFSLPSLGGLLFAIIGDVAVISKVYDQQIKLASYITLIHFVVSVILGTILYGVLALIGSFPG